MGLLRKFQQILPRQSLITIDKLFTRPDLNYGNIVYDPALMNHFTKFLNLFKITHVVITGAVRGTYFEKLLKN